MRVEVLSGGALPPDLIGVGVPVFAHDDGPRSATAVDGPGPGVAVPTTLDPSWCKRHGFTGKVGQMNIAIDAIFNINAARMAGRRPI